MKPKIALVLAVPVLFAFSSRDADIGFGPAPGLSLTKSYKTSSEVSLEEMSVLMNGNEQDSSAMGMEQTVATTTTAVITDEYIRVAGGRPDELKRTYDELASTMSMSMSQAMMGEVDIDLDGESELEGLAVTFTWSEEEGDFVVDFADGADGDEELLEGLIEDTDMRAFLPDSEVAEGDTWEVPTEAIRAILAFGGDLKVELDTSELEDMAGGMGMGGGGGLPTPDEFLGDIDGTITATYAGNDDDGFAEIKLTVEINSAKDITDFFAEGADDLPGEMEMEYESADMEFEFEGEGTLLWDVSAGHLHSFVLTGETTLTIDMAMTMNMAGMGDMELEMSMVMAGDAETSLSVGGSQ